MGRQFYISASIVVAITVSFFSLAGCQTTRSGDGMGNTAELSRQVGAILRRK